MAFHQEIPTLREIPQISSSISNYDVHVFRVINKSFSCNPIDASIAHVTSRSAIIDFLYFPSLPFDTNNEIDQ